MKNIENESRALRGGSWYSVSAYCRASDRFWFTPDYRCGYVGFRVVLSARVSACAATPQDRISPGSL